MSYSGTLLAVASQTVTASGGGTPFYVGAYSTVAVDVNVTANSGTTPTLDIYLDRLGADGAWYNVWHPTQITTTNGAVSTSVGPGCATAAALTGQLRLRWVLGGTSPSYTFSASVVGR